MKEKKKYIVEKATTLFMQRGLKSVSMDDIASYSGISKKTLYGGFESKEKLVKMIVEKFISDTHKYIRISADISPNAVKEVENFTGYIQALFAIVTRKFTRDLKKYYPEQYTQLIVFRDKSIIPYLESCLNRGIREEIFRTGINKRKTGWLYCWQIQNALEGDTAHEDPNSIIENVNDVFLHGILNSKGLKLFSVDKQTENRRKKGTPEHDEVNHVLH